MVRQLRGVMVADDNRTQGQKKSSRLTAGATGAGSGTLLVLLANNLPNASPWKSWLVIAAPSASVFASLVWSKATIALESLFRKREFDALVKHAQETLAQALKSDTTSPEHREKLKGELEQLQLLLVQTDVERIKTLRLQR
jgi:hypothetical protein